MTCTCHGARTSGPVLAAGAAPCGVCMQRSTPECHLMRCAAAKTATKCCPLMLVEPTWNNKRSSHRRKTRPRRTCRHRSTPGCSGSWSPGSWATVPCLRGAMCQPFGMMCTTRRPLFSRSLSASACYISSQRSTRRPSASVRPSVGRCTGSTWLSLRRSPTGRAEKLFCGD